MRWVAIGNAEEQAVADLAGRAGDGDALGGFGHGRSSGERWAEEGAVARRMEAGALRSSVGRPVRQRDSGAPVEARSISRHPSSSLRGT